MQRMLWAAIAGLLAVPALAGAQDSAIGNETVTADQSDEKAESPSAAEAKEPEEFSPPPGYRMKKRGSKFVYCKKDQESGTRFASEVCYDEEQLRQMEKERELGNAAFDQSRKLCAGFESCAGG